MFLMFDYVFRRQVPSINNDNLKGSLLVIIYSRHSLKGHLCKTTGWYEIFAGSIFCIFAVFHAIRKNNPVPANENYRKHFSRKNLLQSKYSQI